MTRARAQEVPVDIAKAYRYLTVAVRLLADSDQEALSPEARYTLAYDAARNAITATLRAAGMRVAAGSHAHVVTFTTAKQLLGGEHVTMLQRLDDVRRVRHEIEYDTREVSIMEFEAILEPTRAIIDAATRYVDAVAEGR
jgi:hypothetical protein